MPSEPETSRTEKRPPAYRIVADRLREDILSGELLPGARLPGEAELGDSLGVSRSTIREAVRALEAQHLVVTTRGTTGGTFVAEPDPERMEDDLRVSIGLLTAAERVSASAIVEAREMLEAPACALAAQRRSEAQLEELRHLAADDEHEAFHMAILDAAGNEMVRALTRPLYAALRHRIRRDEAPAEFWAMIDTDHGKILNAIESGNAEEAEALMRSHLRSLTATYEALDGLRS